MNLHVRSFVLGLGFAAAFILGCVANSVAPDSTVPAARAQSPGQHQVWTQDCFIADDFDVFHEKVKVNGSAGWELISVGVGAARTGIGQEHLYVACFKAHGPVASAGLARDSVGGIVSAR